MSLVQLGTSYMDFESESEGDDFEDHEFLKRTKFRTVLKNLL